MLKRRCEDIFPGSVRAVKIPRHSSGGRSGLSSGYGFVELASVAIAKRALKALQGVLVDGRALEVKPTEKRLTSAKKLADGQKEKLTNGKLMVRNVPFQAAPKEIRDLFATYGQVKTVRMPRKASGSGLRKHRGFAFVEMATAGEAERAMAALVDTHLYGRHLVLESAKEEDGVEELREKAKRDTRDRSSGRNKRLRGEL
jgi:multiple RNA-binding domain-containing protein 1